MRRALPWLAALVLVLLVGLVSTRTQRAPEQRGLPSMSGHSGLPDGALALYRWTQRLGRDAEYLEYRRFRLSERDAVLVSLRPSAPYSPEEVREVRRWLDGGGTLLLGADAGTALLAELDARLMASGGVREAQIAQPLLGRPPCGASPRRAAARSRRKRA